MPAAHHRRMALKSDLHAKTSGASRAGVPGPSQRGSERPGGCLPAASGGPRSRGIRPVYRVFYGPAHMVFYGLFRKQRTVLIKALRAHCRAQGRRCRTRTGRLWHSLTTGSLDIHRSTVTKCGRFDVRGSMRENKKAFKSCQE